MTDYIAEQNFRTSHFEYSPFGTAVVAEGISFLHQFASKPSCQDTGNIEYQKRIYNANGGSWCSYDPLSETDEPNLYLFCLNSPINLFDYLGYESSHTATNGTTHRSWSRHSSYLVFQLSCPKCEKVTAIRIRGQIDVAKCIAQKMFPDNRPKVQPPRPKPNNPRSKQTNINRPSSNPRDPRNRPSQKQSPEEKRKEFVDYWVKQNLSDLKGPGWTDPKTITTNCDGIPIEVWATMRSRFAGLTIGSSEYADCYKRNLGIGYECKKCEEGKE